MQIVILDAFAENPGDLSWDWLNEYGTVTIYDRTPEEKIVERAKDADILILNKTPLLKEHIEKLEKLQFVALLSTGYNIVDGKALRARQIPVCNIPSYSTNAVAQLTFAFILEFANAVRLHSDAVHDGEWVACPDFCFTKAPLFELCGKTLGIVGFGKIGQRVADLAAAFGMRVLAHSGHETDQSARQNFAWASLEDLAAQSDFITFHCPLTPETEGLVDAKFLSHCKTGAYLINTSRGAVLNEAAVAAALQSGKLAGAAVDVLSVEPAQADNPLLHAKNCLITPHIAWAGYETRSRLMDILKDNFKAYFAVHPQNVVN